MLGSVLYHSSQEGKADMKKLVGARGLNISTVFPKKALTGYLEVVQA